MRPKQQRKLGYRRNLRKLKRFKKDVSKLCKNCTFQFIDDEPQFFVYFLTRW